MIGGGVVNNAFKALSDKTRREILTFLKDRDMTAGEIADKFSISKPSISHHLSILKQANLVVDVKDRQNVVYSLNVTVFSEVLGWLMEFFKTELKEDDENGRKD